MDKKPPSIVEFLSEIEDPRRETDNRRHEFIDVLVIALCGMLSSADDWVSIELYGKTNQEWFSSFLSLPNGIPSHDTFNRIFSSIDPNLFMSCFLRWAESIRSKVGREVVAIDGKTLRRSHGASKNSAIHMVSAWASENNLVLGQIKVNEKSNEITAIPELLGELALERCLITIDAMGCQKTIVKTIIDRGGDYLLAVKDNHPTLKKAILSVFNEKKPKCYQSPKIDYFETVEKNRDRKEIRRCWATPSLSKLSMTGDWKGLCQIVKVESERTLNESTSIEQRYYICSLDISAEEILSASRSHWHIENKLHWVLDMAFREDENRTRKGYGAENLSRLRHIALNLLKQDKTKKVGIKNKRLAAGWDKDYLLHLLGFSYET